MSRPILGTARLFAIPGFLTSGSERCGCPGAVLLLLLLLGVLGLRLSDLFSRHPTRACSLEIAPSYNASICWI